MLSLQQNIKITTAQNFSVESRNTPLEYAHRHEIAFTYHRLQEKQ